MDQDVVFLDAPHHVAVVECEVLEAGIRRFDEDRGLPSGRAQRSVDAEHLVPYCVTVAEGGQHLVHPRTPGSWGTHPRRSPSMTAPDGMPASTDSAAGREARRRASHPGSGAMGGGAVSRSRRWNISRYLRSITGQA